MLEMSQEYLLKDLLMGQESRLAKEEVKEKPDGDPIELDVLIVGAGFSGMYMLYKLRKLGLKVLILESGSDVGGTWYWNRYPGARCDVESMEYSYSFSEELQQEWEWSHRFSTQPEILNYASHVADRFDLRTNIKFDSHVESTTYQEGGRYWIVVTVAGEIYTSRYCVMATGTLSLVNEPKFEGVRDFKGDWHVTGRWPHEAVNFSGKKIGIIGTGSSAVQAIPVIAREAEKLTVFQRTANYSIPANNRLLSSIEVKEFKRNYGSIRETARNNRAGIASMKIGSVGAVDVSESDRNLEYEDRWQDGGTNFLAFFNDIGTNVESNKTAAEFVKGKIREIVNDASTAELLSPTNTIGCKRLCADTEYFETYNRSNVDLIDVNQTPIVRIVEKGVETSARIHEFDMIIYAIGFDAMTGALNAMDIIGRSNVILRDKWNEGPRTYLGLSISEFPNLFTITGPGSPSVLSNMMTSIEQHVDWISKCIQHMEANGFQEIEASLESENRWMEHVADVADGTLRYTCNSWYVGANIPGKKRVFTPYAGGLPQYTDKCNEVANDGYHGFILK